MRAEDSGCHVQVDLTTCILPMPRAPRCPACDGDWGDSDVACANCQIPLRDALQLVAEDNEAMAKLRRSEPFPWWLCA